MTAPRSATAAEGERGQTADLRWLGALACLASAVLMVSAVIVCVGWLL